MSDEIQRGLSFSGMKDLMISPFRYWHLHINPDRPEREETPAMAFGTALHCAVLEPGEFNRRYCRAFNPDEHDGALDTVTDLQNWLRDHGIKTGGSRQELIERIVMNDPDVPIMRLLQDRHAAQNVGKTVLSDDFWERIGGAAAALRAEPSLMAILADGKPEVAMSAVDPRTGVLLKARMDWVNPAVTIDVKTFSQQRGKSIDKSVNDALWYEHYLLQAYLYSYIRSLQPKAAPIKQSRFLFAFVESDPPHETRLREIVPVFGEVCMAWEHARHQVHGLIELYAECMERFGENPWRPNQEIAPVLDEDISQLAWS